MGIYIGRVKGEKRVMKYGGAKWPNQLLIFSNKKKIVGWHTTN